jgi:hypothetical protein
MTNYLPTKLAIGLALGILASTAPKPAWSQMPAAKVYKSVYLTQSVAGAHRITFTRRGRFKGTIHLDRNACGIDLHGTTTQCTLMYNQPIKVTISPVLELVRNREGRRLFSVRGGRLPGGLSFYLSLAPNGKNPARLVVAEGKRRQVAVLIPQL